MFDPDECYLSLLLVDARPFHPDRAAGSSDAVSHGSPLWLDNRHMVFTAGCLYLFTSSRSLASLFCLLGWLQSVSGVNSTELERKKEVVCCCFFSFHESCRSLTSTPADPTKLVHIGLKSQSGISSTVQSLILRNKPNGTNIWSICCKMGMIVFNVNAKCYIFFYVVPNVNFCLTRNVLQIHPHAPLHRFLFFFYFFFSVLFLSQRLQRL